MPSYIKTIIKAVIVVAVIGVPLNLYLLFEGDAAGAFGLIAGAVALYFAAKVLELAKTPVIDSDR